MRLNRVLEAVALVDLDLDPAGGDVAEQLAGQLGALGGVGDVVGQRRPRDVERSLDRELERVDRRDRAGGGADADQQAAAPQRVERLDGGVLADAVEDDGDADAAGEFAYALDPVLLRVEDGVIAAVRAGDLRLGLGGDGADDGEAEQLAPTGRRSDRRRRPRRAAGSCRRPSALGRSGAAGRRMSVRAWSSRRRSRTRSRRAV